MPPTLEELESLRDTLRRQLFEIGDFRSGTVYPSYRKCGKRNCACAKPHHPGHLQYLRTTAKGGKNRSQMLHMGPQLEKAIKEAENYQRFVKLCRELVETNEWICELRPVREVKNPEEFEALKKNCRGNLLGGCAGNRSACAACISGYRATGPHRSGGERNGYSRCIAPDRRQSA